MGDSTRIYRTEQRQVAVTIAREEGVVTPAMLRSRMEMARSTASLILSAAAEVGILRKVSAGTYVLGPMAERVLPA
jgi:hypothetical protein